MGVFSRFRDIVSANINAMLEKAEDPEKLIKLIIQEMEDTLVQMKASCASAMADTTRVRRALDEARERASEWRRRAKLAIEKAHEDMARQAVLHKRRFDEQTAAREDDLKQRQELIAKYQADIEELEEKLAKTRRKYKILLQRQRFAQERKQARTGIRRAETSDAFVRFDLVENRVDRLESEADLVDSKRRSSLDEEFERLETDDVIEEELAALKREVADNKGSARE